MNNKELNIVDKPYLITNPYPMQSYAEYERYVEMHTTKKQREDAVRTKPVEPALHVHRNDPCICGSGKKFKNCCWS